MIIRIFDANETSFSSNGLGTIKPIKCIESKKISLNGWSVSVTCSIEYADVVQKDNIIMIPTKEKGNQRFRIDNPKKTERKIEFTARHVLFDSEKYFLEDVRPTDLGSLAFLNWINDRTDITSPFIFVTSLEGQNTQYFIRKNLFEALSSTEELFGGVFDANNYTITMKETSGIDNGFRLLYRKNIQGATIVEKWDNVVTRIYPTGPDNLVLPEGYIDADVSYPTPYTKTISFEVSTDLSDEEKITTLRDKANAYLDERKYPEINYTITSDIDQDLIINETIHIKHPLVDLEANVQEYEYNVLTKKITKLVFGNYSRDAKTAFNSKIETINQQIGVQSDYFNKLINSQTEIIAALNKTGYVYIDENEIMILDALPKEDAVSVWRFGLAGIAYSGTGIEGPFTSAWVYIDGAAYLNADFIAAGTITTSHVSDDFGTGLDISSNLSITSKVSQTTYDDQVNNLQSNISALLEQSGINADNIESVTQQLTSQIIQNANSITATLTSIQTIADALSGKMSTSELQKYLRFDEDYLHIGNNQSAFEVVVGPTEIAFMEGERKVAYISNQEFNFNQGVVAEYLKIGTFKISYDTVTGFTIS